MFQPAAASLALPRVKLSTYQHKVLRLTCCGISSLFKVWKWQVVLSRRAVWWIISWPGAVTSWCPCRLSGSRWRDKTKKPRMKSQFCRAIPLTCNENLMISSVPRFLRCGTTAGLRCKHSTAPLSEKLQGVWKLPINQLRNLCFNTHVFDQLVWRKQRKLNRHISLTPDLHTPVYCSLLFPLCHLLPPLILHPLISAVYPGMPSSWQVRNQHLPWWESRRLHAVSLCLAAHQS